MLETKQHEAEDIFWFASLRCCCRGALPSSALLYSSALFSHQHSPLISTLHQLPSVISTLHQYHSSAPPINTTIALLTARAAPLIRLLHSPAGAAFFPFFFFAPLPFGEGGSARAAMAVISLFGGRVESTGASSSRRSPLRHPCSAMFSGVLPTTLTGVSVVDGVAGGMDKLLEKLLEKLLDTRPTPSRTLGDAFLRVRTGKGP